MNKRGIQPLLLAVRKELQIILFHEVLTMSTKSNENLLPILHISPDILFLRGELSNACKAQYLAVALTSFIQWSIGHTSAVRLCCVIIF
jgi:hypothetical protein